MENAHFFELLRTGDLGSIARALDDEPACAALRDAAGLSAVTWALYNRKPEIVALLLAKSPPIDVFEAAALGRTEDLAGHVARDPESARGYSADGFAPLHLAAFFSQLGTARLLVDRGADVRAVARNPSRVEPLHSAAAGGEIEIVDLLLRAGADPNGRQHGGYTPLHSGASQGNVALIRMLRAHGADPALKADDGRSALDMAGDRAEVVAALRS